MAASQQASEMSASNDAYQKIFFNRNAFVPYLDKLGSEKKLDEMFLEFLKERVG